MTLHYDNEMCACGHPKSEHWGIPVLGETGHGPCANDCDCNKFTWTHFMRNGKRLLLVDTYENADGYVYCESCYEKLSVQSQTDTVFSSEYYSEDRTPICDGCNCTITDEPF